MALVIVALFLHPWHGVPTLFLQFFALFLRCPSPAPLLHRLVALCFPSPSPLQTCQKMYMSRLHFFIV